jgi:hypothetical protein
MHGKSEENSVAYEYTFYECESMRPELHHIEKIERYLSGLMTQEEKREMETLLLSDAALQEELRLQRWMLEGIEQAGWREELNAIHEGLPASGQDSLGGSWYGFLMLALLTIGVGFYLYRAPSHKAAMLVDSSRVSINIELPAAKTAVNDTLNTTAPVNDDSVYWRPELKGRISQLVPPKNTNAPESPVIPAVHYYPAYEEFKKEYYTQWYKVKEFPELQDARMIILPVTSLDYDFHFQREADPLLDYKFNLLLDDKYEKTYVATISFRYRMEGAIMYNDKADVINLYLKNTNLLLWQVDSMAAELLKSKAIEHCEKRDYWLSGYEYFRWLSNQRQGELLYTPCVQRNYRKGGVYKAVEQEKEERYFISCGLTPEEARGVFDYFKNMYEIRSRFRVAFKEEHNLRYHYDELGYEVNIELPVCK